MSFLTFDESTHTYRFNGKDVMTTKHTPEPWEYGEDCDSQQYIEGVANPGVQIAYICYYGDFNQTVENARRIVACVNACKGVSTEALENIAKASPGLIATAHSSF